MSALSISKVFRDVSKATFYTSSALLVIIMFLVTIDITGRTFFNAPLLGTLEICEFLLAGAVMLGMGHTQSLGGHVMVELLYERMSPRWQKVQNIFSILVGIVIFGLVTWQGGVYALSGYENHLTSDILKIPAWPALFFVPIGSFLFTVELVIELGERLNQSRKEEE